MHVPCRIQEIVNKTDLLNRPLRPKNSKWPCANTHRNGFKLCGLTRGPIWSFRAQGVCSKRSCFKKIVDRIYDISCKSFSAVTDLPVPSLPPFCLFSPGQAGQFPNKSFKASHSITYKCKLQDIEFLLAGDPILEILETASCTLDVFQLVSDEQIFAKPIQNPKVKHDKD